MTPARDISRLVEIMAALRDDETGCPWDIAQSFATIAPYTIEEAYEVAEAIAGGDMAELRDELGDLLLQVVYHARMAEEIGAFALPDVIEAIAAKLIRRHPHVFGDAETRAAGAAKGFWETAKAEEKRGSNRTGGVGGKSGLLDDTGTPLPALIRAVRLQEKAATVGFDWNDPHAVVAKLREELAEVEAEIGRSPAPAQRLEDEIGDLVFAVVNLARHLKVDADQALRRANLKFRRRFAAIETALAADGRSPAEASLDEMEALWRQVKAAEA